MAWVRGAGRRAQALRAHASALRLPPPLELLPRALHQLPLLPQLPLRILTPTGLHVGALRVLLTGHEAATAPPQASAAMGMAARVWSSCYRAWRSDAESKATASSAASQLQRRGGRQVVCTGPFEGC